MKPLAVIPAFLTQMSDVSVLEVCVSTFRRTIKDTCDLIVVDDGSPESDLVSAARGMVEGFDGEFVAKQHNEGFSATVNVGLRRALNAGRDAVLVNADIEFFTETWLDLMLRQQRDDGEGLASVVGALLLFPNRTIQHAGVYFSLLSRSFDHIYRYGPHNLPEARRARVCPVTGALQFIRAECLQAVGVYDDSFKMGWEDVDFCVRVWLSGRQCIYQPGVQAVHHEGFFRNGQRHAPDSKVAQWTAASWQRFKEKHRDVSFAEFIPSLV